MGKFVQLKKGLPMSEIVQMIKQHLSLDHGAYINDLPQKVTDDSANLHTGRGTPYRKHRSMRW